MGRDGGSTRLKIVERRINWICSAEVFSSDIVGIPGDFGGVIDASCKCIITTSILPKIVLQRYCHADLQSDWI